MCGICGVFSLDGSLPEPLRVSQMSDALSRRGPDDQGAFAAGPVALGFRRLSILDLEGGHQPMTSEDGRFTVVFNGEIYNHPRLKAEFEAQGAKYRTKSDTETILRVFQRHGKDALAKLRGMFALGLWDSREGRLLLARDPMGIKPLYYAQVGQRLFFASELRALVRAGVPADLDMAGLNDYLSYGYVHSPRTVLAAVKKLEPGQWLEADAKGVRLGRYFELPNAEVRPMGEAECLEKLEGLLTAAVRSHLLSDVPVGAFLSGGIDSSLVAALMAEKGPVETFSIGFEGAERGVDESAWAAQVARHLGTKHHSLMLPADVLGRLSDAVEALDEPLADSAVLPTYLLSKFAKEKVKVVLTGEGADEIFAGYGRYKAAYLTQRAAGLPGPLRSMVLAGARRWGGSSMRRVPIDDVKGWARACRLSPKQAVYSFMSPAFVEAAEADDSPWLAALDGRRGVSGALAHDLRTVLADCLLMKADKASMRASLEARVPFLDLDLVRFALEVPAELKLRGFKSKWILRQLAKKRLPAAVVRRPKHGFIVPWERWVRSPSQEVDEALEGLADAGLFELDLLRKAFFELREGSPFSDAGLHYRIAVFALWRADLRRRCQTPA